MIVLLDAFARLGAFVYTRDLSDVDTVPEQLTDPRGLSRYTRIDSNSAGNIFLVTRAGDPILQKGIRVQGGGGIRISTDQSLNPHAIVLRLGGQVDNHRTLVATSLDTTGETPMAKGLFKVFKRLVVRNAKYMDGAYVMSRASDMLQSGWRLT